MHKLSDYDYHLPPKLIAQTATHPADSCKLLVYDRETKTHQDKHFGDLSDFLDSQTLIVFNTSKVVKARIPLPQIKGEIFYLNALDTHRFTALIRPGKKFKIGKIIALPDTDITFSVEAMTHNGRQLRCSHPILEVLEQYGQMPLPPYISYDKSKEEDYQTVFAQQPGSVAAPTASLHFTPKLLQDLEKKGIQRSELLLHVGLGTFKQVDTEDIQHYDIHSEIVEVPLQLFTQLARAKQDKKVLAVGTTVTRSLESLPYLRILLDEETKQLFPQETQQQWNTCCQDLTPRQAQQYVLQPKLSQHQSIRFASKLFIYPGFTYRVLDQLITNFHLPKSSLLMLVAGYMGYREMMGLYTHAIQHQYRFYSFGDAMLIH